MLADSVKSIRGVHPGVDLGDLKGPRVGWFWDGLASLSTVVSFVVGILDKYTFF